MTIICRLRKKGGKGVGKLTCAFSIEKFTDTNVRIERCMLNEGFSYSISK